MTSTEFTNTEAEGEYGDQDGGENGNNDTSSSLSSATESLINTNTKN